MQDTHCQIQASFGLQRIEVDTSVLHPGRVFLHAWGSGFNACHSFDMAQAEKLIDGLKKAMTVARSHQETEQRMGREVAA